MVLSPTCAAAAETWRACAARLVGPSSVGRHGLYLIYTSFSLVAWAHLGPSIFFLVFFSLPRERRYQRLDFNLHLFLTLLLSSGSSSAPSYRLDHGIGLAGLYGWSQFGERYICTTGVRNVMTETIFESISIAQIEQKVLWEMQEVLNAISPEFKILESTRLYE